MNSFALTPQSLYIRYSGIIKKSVIGDHQEVRNPVQPARQLIGIELIDSVKGLELAAGPAVQFGKGNNFMNLWDDRLCAAVPVGIDGENFLVPFHKDVVNAPGVDGQAPNVILLFCFCDARFHMVQKRIHIPDKMPVLFRYAVGEAVNLSCLDFSVLKPANNMPPGGGTDINGKTIVYHPSTSPLMFVISLIARS